MSSRLASVAGFVDGEGCFSISKNGSVSLPIVNTSKSVLLFIQEVLGFGVVQPRKQRVNKTQHVFRVYGDNCMAAIEALLPYLIDKKKQAETLLEYRNLPSTISIPGVKGHFKNPAREGYAQRLKELKKHEEL